MPVVSPSPVVEKRKQKKEKKHKKKKRKTSEDAADPEDAIVAADPEDAIVAWSAPSASSSTAIVPFDLATSSTPTWRPRDALLSAAADNSNECQMCGKTFNRANNNLFSNDYFPAVGYVCCLCNELLGLEFERGWWRLCSQSERVLAADVIKSAKDLLRHYRFRRTGYNQYPDEAQRHRLWWG